MSAIKLAGGWDGDFSSIIEYAKDKNTGSNIIKFFSSMGKGAKEAAAEVDASASTIQKGLAGIKGGLKGAWDSLGLFGKIGIVVTALGTLYGIYQKIQNAGAEANQKMEESVSKYEQTTSEIESVNSELSETQRQVDILQAKGSLSLVEQSELEKLQSQTRELERQKDLLEKMAEIEAKDAAKDAAKAVKKNYQNLPTSMEDIQKQFDYYNQEGWYRDPADSNIAGQMALIEKYKSEQMKYVKGSEKWEAYDQLIESTSDKVWTAIKAFQDYKATLEDLPEDARGPYEDLINDLDSSIDTVYKLLDNKQWKQMKLDDIYSNGELKEARDTLVQMAADSNDVGITVSDITDGFGDLAKAAEDAGLSVGDLVTDINAAAGVVPGGREAKRRFAKNSFAKSSYIKGLGSNDDAMSKITSFGDWLDSLDDNEMSIVYNLSLDTSSADWSLDEWKKHLLGAADGTDEYLGKVKDSSKKTIEAISGIQNVQSVLSSQTAGKSVSTDVFSSDDLKDYASALEYVNGTYQLNIEKVNELVKAKADEQIQVNKTNKAHAQSEYLENARKIAEYRDMLNDASQVEKYSADAINDSINALLAKNDALADQCSQYDLMNSAITDATGAYQAWLDAQNAPEPGDMLDDVIKAFQTIYDTLYNQESDLYGRIGGTKYKAALNLVLPDNIDKENRGAIDAWWNSFSQYLLRDGNEIYGADLNKFLDNMYSSGLLEKDGDGYKIVAGKISDDFAKAAEASGPVIQSFFDEFNAYGAKLNFSDEVVKTVGDLGVAAVEAYESLRKLDQFKDLKIVLDVSDFEAPENALATLDDTIEKVKGERDKLDPQIDTTQIEQANDILRYCIVQKQILTQPDIMTVDTSKVTSSIGDALALLQQFHQAENNLNMDAEMGADTTKAKSQINDLVAQIQSIDPEVLATIGLNPASEKEIQDYINNLDAEAIVNFGIDSSLVDAFEETDHTVTGSVVWQDDVTYLSKSFTVTGYRIMGKRRGIITETSCLSAIYVHLSQLSLKQYGPGR